MALVSNDEINAVRAKADIISIVGSYIPLTQKGKNYFCVCPFHDDHSPSMSLSTEKQIYKCFSCGASGNIFTFLSEYENISFKQALEVLASRVGYKLSSSTVSNKSNINEKFYEMYDLTLKFYQNNINTVRVKKQKNI